MCRILVQGCKNASYICTKSGETHILCSILENGLKDVRKEELSTQINVLHTEFPEFHKLIFNQIALKELEDDLLISDHPAEITESLADSQEVQEIIDTDIVKEEETVVEIPQSIESDDVEEEKHDGVLVISSESSEESSESSSLSDLIPQLLLMKSRQQEKRASTAVCKYLISAVSTDSSDDNSGHHTKAREKSFKCKRCSQSFDNFNVLKSHKKVHMRERASSMLEGKVLQIKLNRIDDEFSRKSSEDSDQSDSSQSSSDDVRPKRIRRPTLQCNNCPRMFKSYYTLDRHKATIHSNEGKSQPFHCAECGRGYKSKNTLAIHLKRNIHRKLRKKYNCSQSHKNFTPKRGWKEHQEVKHSEDTKTAT